MSAEPGLGGSLLTVLLKRRSPPVKVETRATRAGVCWRNTRQSASLSNCHHPSSPTLSCQALLMRGTMAL